MPSKSLVKGVKGIRFKSIRRSPIPKRLTAAEKRRAVKNRHRNVRRVTMQNLVRGAAAVGLVPAAGYAHGVSSRRDIKRRRSKRRRR